MRRALRKVSETRRRYKDADGNTRAVVFNYRNADDTQEQAVRMLRDDNGVEFNVEVE